jgi:hypothetical protein
MAHYHVLTGAETFHAQPTVRRIGLADIKDALARGVDDFMAMPSHAVFLCLIYPIVGILLGSLTFGFGFISLLYPLVAGFALLGPFAAIGLYELSRQRERGLQHLARGPAGISNVRASFLGGHVCLPLYRIASPCCHPTWHGAEGAASLLGNLVSAEVFQARRSVSSVISGGTPIRTGMPKVPNPRFT